MQIVSFAINVKARLDFARLYRELIPSLYFLSNEGIDGVFQNFIWIIGKTHLRYLVMLDPLRGDLIYSKISPEIVSLSSNLSRALSLLSLSGWSSGSIFSTISRSSFFLTRRVHRENDPVTIAPSRVNRNAENVFGFRSE